MMQQVFEGLELNLEEASELSYYLKAAKGKIGVIHANGYMTTSDGTWERPRAANRYIRLRKALERTPEAKGITLEEDSISFNPQYIRYNLKAIREFIAINHYGVKDTPEGLSVYRKRKAHYTGVWFERILWEFQGITINMLDTNTAKIVSLTPAKNNPDEAEWATLHFVA